MIKKISIVVPVYNEEENIGNFLPPIILPNIYPPISEKMQTHKIVIKKIALSKLSPLSNNDVFK